MQDRILRLRSVRTTHAPIIPPDQRHMKKLVLLLAVFCASCARLEAADPEVARWESQAKKVTIIRDDWGIAHIYGKTDANVVFGLMYAQAEDDFNRVETNYINSMGRLSEAEGEAEIYRD